MVKKISTGLLSICLLLFCGVMFSACTLDLSHKHVCDKYGYCNSCSTDTCVVLTPAGTGYTSNQVYVKSGNNQVYYKFVGNGQGSLTLVFNSNVAKVSNLQLYTKTNSSFYFTSSDNYTKFTYNYTFTQGETYYIQLKVNADAYVTLTAEVNNL